MGSLRITHAREWLSEVIAMGIEFETKAKAGYAALVLLLATGMGISVWRLSRLADDQVVRLRAQEHQITLVDRLRWNSELIVSNGRGYLLSGEPKVLELVRRAARRFDQHIRELDRAQLGPKGAVLVERIHRSAEQFRRVQHELLEKRSATESPAAVVEQFDRELLPLRSELDENIERLVEHKQQVLDGLYGDMRSEGDRLAVRMYGLLTLLALAGLVAAWYFARQLVRSYHQERAAGEAARNAIAAREALMGMVAHDLRNPLGAITLKATLLRQAPLNPEAVCKHAESIEQIALRMARLIASMLDVATIEAGGFSVERSPCAVDSLLSESRETLGGLAESKQIKFEQSVKQRGLQVLADRERVLQVLSNLLGNAFKFTPPEGRVTLVVERQGSEVCFRVADEGPGIAQEHLAHVFDRFWKHEGQGNKGTGLGLFIAKGIVEAHGGRIWAESLPAGGAMFSFTLPLVEAARSDRVHAAAGVTVPVAH